MKPVAGLLIAATALASPKPFIETTVVYRAKSDGYFVYRIPSAIVAPDGSLLTFIEGRKDSANDESNIKVLMKRSTDHGRTWSAAKVLADHGNATIGNPCAVVDRKTKTVFLFLTGNPIVTRQELIDSVSVTRKVWLMKSADSGKTWTEPADITASVKEPGWGWYASGPGVGIQLASGRLVIPCNHRAKGGPTPYSHVTYSDDHGASWKIGGTMGENTNESQVVELADGSLMFNARSYAGKSHRAVAISRDAGITWTDLHLDDTLVEPICQASFLRFTREPRSKNRILFSNPADPKERKHMTIRLSYDEGKTWAVSKLLDDGFASYSSLVVLPDHTIGCFYEKGPQRECNMVFSRFNLEWLTDNHDHLR